MFESSRYVNVFKLRYVHADAGDVQPPSRPASSNSRKLSKSFNAVSRLTRSEIVPGSVVQLSYGRSGRRCLFEGTAPSPSSKWLGNAYGLPCPLSKLSRSVLASGSLHHGSLHPHSSLSLSELPSFN